MTSEESLGRVPLHKDRKDRKTVLGYPRADLLTLLIGMPVLGLLVGLALPPLARWLSHSPVLPWRDGITFVGSLDKPWQTGVVVGVALVAGAVLAVADIDEALKLKLTDGELETEKASVTRTIRRDRVSAVFLDGKELVVLDESSREVARGEHKASAATLAGAFRAHGYPWRDADPYAGAFHRWIPGAPGLPAEAHAVLAARKVALKSEDGEDVRDLGGTLQDLGYVVRDEGKKQYWRSLAAEAGKRGGAAQD